MIVMIPAKDIPNNATVSKSHNGKPYILKDAVTIYSAIEGDKKKQSLTNPNGRFLIGSPNGDINIIDKTKMLFWDVSEPALLAYLENRVYDL